MKSWMVPLSKAHVLASVLAEVIALAVAELAMGSNLSPMRMVMGIVFSPLLAPVSVILVPLGVLTKHAAPRMDYLALAGSYVVGLAVCFSIFRRSGGAK
jgi:hypothetical protein